MSEVRDLLREIAIEIRKSATHMEGSSWGEIPITDKKIIAIAESIEAVLDKKPKRDAFTPKAVPRRKKDAQ